MRLEKDANQRKITWGTTFVRMSYGLIKVKIDEKLI